MYCYDGCTPPSIWISDLSQISKHTFKTHHYFHFRALGKIESNIKKEKQLCVSKVCNKNVNVTKHSPKAHSRNQTRVSRANRNSSLHCLCFYAGKHSPTCHTEFLYKYRMLSLSMFSNEYSICIETQIICMYSVCSGPSRLGIDTYTDMYVFIHL